jgi:hypothetical protein
VPLLERFKKTRNCPPETPCVFRPSDPDIESLNLSPGPAVEINEELSETLIDRTVQGEALKFWPWVNQARTFQVTVGLLTLIHTCS